MRPAEPFSNDRINDLCRYAAIISARVQSDAASAKINQQRSALSRDAAIQNVKMLR
ncbi:hypothetical protein [Pacificibacter marinus]|uniref:hypothetical protein n=1 Tax=Pacificibacter marinus TaxID=658057 RepID=UPI001C075949|nr:hypothetical protein [Pacificibacter marinus]MBU2868469.1 hypothetical protein [Pacificibacter marinus]